MVLLILALHDHGAGWASCVREPERHQRPRQRLYQHQCQPHLCVVGRLPTLGDQRQRCGGSGLLRQHWRGSGLLLPSVREYEHQLRRGRAAFRQDHVVPGRDNARAGPRLWRKPDRHPDKRSGRPSDQAGSRRQHDGVAGRFPADRRRCSRIPGAIDFRRCSDAARPICL